MKSLILLLTLIGYIFAKDVLNEKLLTEDILFEEDWESFKVEYDKSFQQHNEEQYRKQVFKNNKDLIGKHNLRYKTGKESYKMGVNQFTDLRHEEFVNLLMDSQNRTTYQSEYIYSPQIKVDLPESFDWRKKGAVSAVKQQGKCSSGWAFAAVGCLEGQHFLKTKKLLDFSAQNLLDCSSVAPYKNLGCKGGNPEEALRYVKQNHGINTLHCYAYEGHANKCRFKKDHIGLVIQGSVSVKSGDEAALEAAVAQKGPIALTIDASNLQHYLSGVYNTPCKGPAKYQSMLLVGYGKDPKTGNFWLLKNSWGKWGEEGYLRLARGKNNLCGIANSAVFAML